MTAKTTILRKTTFKDFGELYRFLRSDAMRAYLSRGQVETIADVLDASLPDDVTLEQRTPKGTTYLYIDDELRGTVNQTGQYRPPHAPRSYTPR